MSVLNLTSDDFDEIVANGKVLVDFTATWCPPCKILNPIIDELAGELEGQAKICKVDIDGEQALAKRFKVMSVPTVLVFHDGEEKSRLIGVKPKEEYLDELR